MSFLLTPSPAGPRITPEMLDQIKEGMTQAEVEQLLGAPGKVLSRERVAHGVDEGKEMKSVRWEDGRGNHLQVTFLDDRLISWGGKAK